MAAIRVPPVSALSSVRSRRLRSRCDQRHELSWCTCSIMKQAFIAQPADEPLPEGVLLRLTWHDIVPCHAAPRKDPMICRLNRDRFIVRPSLVTKLSSSLLR